MPRIIKIIGYVFLFLFSFFVFLYWGFPYDVLKGRLTGGIEQQLGQDYDVRIGELSPSFFTGAALKNVKIIKHSGDKTSTFFEAERVKLRVSLSSLLFGGTSFSFSVKNKKSALSGDFRSTDEGFSFNAGLDDFNLGDMGFLSGGEGSVKLSSSINGSIKLSYNKKQVMQSTGSADLTLSDIKTKEGELRITEGLDLKLPELLFSKGSGSTLKLEMSRGSIKVKELKLQDGDLKLDLTGDIFMSSSFKNYRMNLKGNFATTPKLEQAVPFLFMVEKQKQADGSYPLNLTGPFVKPSVKIGEITVPM